MAVQAVVFAVTAGGAFGFHRAGTGRSRLGTR